MTLLIVNGLKLQLLPEKAVYSESMRALFLSDVHLGKSETFQHYGVPVSNQVNRQILDRLQHLCQQTQADSIWILGDLFHAREGLVDEVIDNWLKFLEITQVQAHLILGNHDRGLLSTLQQISINCFTDSVAIEDLLLSHEPVPQPPGNPSSSPLNLCGHIHPCLRLQTRLDRLRLPCFHWQKQDNRLTLPAFGEFTGGYDVRLTQEDVAYVVAEDQVVPIAGAASP